MYDEREDRFARMRVGSDRAAELTGIARDHLEAQIADPALREKLWPDYPIGCKRILISDDWYPALQRPNVALVTSPVERVTRDAVITADGAVHATDALIFATGFDTTGFLAPMQIVGKAGVELATTWRAGAEAHRGVTVSGFPNLFLLYGPNTNLGHNSIVFMIECQVGYVLGCLRELTRRGARWLDVKPEVMARSNQQLQHELARTTWSADCHSWYKTEDGKITNNWSGRSTAYWWHTRKPDFEEFEIA
jgi:cation diffusion facilitator CzcD-associated flavoprotein CzcO